MNRKRWLKLFAAALILGALAVGGAGSTLAWGPGGSGSGSGRGMMDNRGWYGTSGSYGYGMMGYPGWNGTRGGYGCGMMGGW